MSFEQRPDRHARAAAAVLLVFLRPPRRRVLAGLVLGAAIVAPLAVRGSLTGGIARIGAVGPAVLVGGGVVLTLAQAAAACAWRAALGACGAEVSVRRTFSCYGAGSLANSVLPGGAGDALRVGLFARAAGRDARWLCGGVCVALSAGRGLVFSALLAGGVAGGLLPGRYLLAPLVGAIGVVAAVLVARRRGGRRLGELARGASAVTPAVVGWLGLVLALRLGVAVYLLHSLGVSGAVGGGVLLLSALGAASAVTLTPGNVGVASAAVALALAHAGVDPSTAAAAGIAYHGLETAAGLGFGSLGCLLKTRLPRVQAEPQALS